MLGDMMGNMEEHQKALKEKLSKVSIEKEAGGGAVKVTIDGNKKITALHLNPDAMDWDDKEQVEDLVIIAVNQAIEEAEETAAAETQKLLQDMLPPGFGNMFG